MSYSYLGSGGITTVVDDDNITFSSGTCTTASVYEFPKIRPSFDEYPKGVWIPGYDEKYNPKGYIRKSIHYQYKRMWK